MPKVKVGDINMYYESHGKGEPLVWINGRHMCTELLWRHVPVFAREYRVITFDNRGAGKSDAPDVPCTIDTMAEDMAGMLDAIGIQSAHFAGYSMGTKVAEEFAFSHPDRVRSLILVCYAPPNPDVPHEPYLTMDERIRWLERPLEERVRSLFEQVVSEKFIQKNHELAEKMVQIMIDGYGSPQGQKRMVQASYSHNNYKRLPEIKAPTLVLAGGDDITVPLENLRSMAERIQGAELAVVEKAGHFLMWEAFDESNRIMLDFLRKHRSNKA
jgi:pimeloyl-ACP methyl ester carboxylesterase